MSGWTYIRWYHYLLRGRAGVAKMKADNIAYFQANSIAARLGRKDSATAGPSGTVPFDIPPPEYRTEQIRTREDMNHYFELAALGRDGIKDGWFLEHYEFKVDGDRVSGSARFRKLIPIEGCP